ncbi:MAG: PD-(D/E)XK nuclease-like domain-containing protein, partial [Nitrososphaeraceae archaeon]|nr:PD-(D/E)XK nuclease-like domain-containing protein [Nitrososphaeraceae archaeon]
ISSSQLKLAYESHENFRWYMNFKKKEERKWVDNNAMDFGTLVHAMYLEPETVRKDFAFMDTAGRNWRTNL